MPASAAARSQLFFGEPFPKHDALDPAHCLFFGNAGVGHTVHVPREECLLVEWGQIAIVGDPFVV